MAQCGQCGGKAMVQVDGGHLLCLARYKTWQDVLLRQNDELGRIHDYLVDHMEATVGLPGMLPRMRRPERPTINTAAMTFNNITVSDSVVGVINTGTVEKLDVAVDAVRDDGQEHVVLGAPALSGGELDHRDGRERPDC